MSPIVVPMESPSATSYVLVVTCLGQKKLASRN